MSVIGLSRRLTPAARIAVHLQPPFDRPQSVAPPSQPGEVLVDQFARDRTNRDDVWALIDWTLTHHERAYDHRPADERLTTQVRLTFGDRTTRAAKVAHPRSTGDRSLTNATEPDSRLGRRIP